MINEDDFDEDGIQEMEEEIDQIREDVHEIYALFINRIDLEEQHFNRLNELNEQIDDLLDTEMGRFIDRFFDELQDLKNMTNILFGVFEYQYSSKNPQP